jgi:haloacetate dehalogenase
MAADMVAVMRALGHERFRVASHDRGARVAHRLALDHGERVEQLAVLDIVPTLEHFERTDMAFAMGYYHWFWFAQKAPFPEDLISAAPDVWWRSHIGREPKDGGFFAPEALEDYLAAVHDPAMIRGMCEDYRAAATIDLEHDRACRAAGTRIGCDLLVLWGDKGRIGAWYDPIAVWRAYADASVTGGSIGSGHYLAEEAADEVLDHFERFFG